MPISYRRLWHMLEKKNLSKTDFRNLTGISTATLAKLSADDVVALPVLEKVCQVLNCQIEDVLEVIPAVSRVRWRRVQTGKNYVVRLLYLSQQNSTMQRANVEPPLTHFLYGYAAACEDEAKPRHVWELEKTSSSEPFEVWAISLTTSGETLSALISCMEQKKSIQSFMEQSGTRLNPPSRKSDQWIVPAISSTAFYPGEIYYRPEILLIPEMESCKLKESFQPIHSPDEEPLFCEAFISGEGCGLYCGKDGDPDPDRMDVIRNAFIKEGVLLNGNRDLVRIGTFEVLSHMKEGVMQRELYSVKPIIDKQESFQKCIAGYLITVFHQHLRGDYRLEVSVYNAGNITACKVFDLTVDGKDVVRQIDLEESSGNLEVRLFEIGSGERIELIGFKSLSLIREISLGLDVVGRRSRLIDRYTKREKNADRRIERYSSEHIHIGDSGNDPWRKQYERIYDDFEELYGSEWAESKVFSHQGASHEEFLHWLKEKTNGNGIRRVYLFDPYIDAESIYRIIRMIGNTDIRYTIVTDAHAKSRTPDRIEKVETVCKGLDILLPQGTRVVAFDHSKEQSVLHDRLLFLVGDRYLPEVYSMSNSLDNVGIKSPSVVCRLTRGAASELTVHYIGLLEEMESAGQLRVLWDSVESRQSKASRTSEINVPESLSTAIFPFNRILEQYGKQLIAIDRNGLILWPHGSSEQEQSETATLLCSAAASHWEEFTGLFYNAKTGRQMLSKGLRAAFDSHLEQKLTSVMADFLNELKANSKMPENLGMEVSPALDFREILRMCAWLIDNPWECDHSRKMRPDISLAVGVLIHCGFSVFSDMFTDVCAIRSKVSVDTMYGLLELLAAEMDLSPAVEQSKLAEKCLRSQNPYLIAAGIQWYVRQYQTDPKTLEYAAQLLDGTNYCQELFREVVIEHQILFLRKPDQMEESDNSKHGSDLKQLKMLWAHWLPPGLDRDQMDKLFDGLDSCSANDTCDMVSLALEHGKTTLEDAQEYLIACMFRKSDDYIKLEKGSFGTREIQDGECFLNALISLCGQSGIQNLLKKLAASEKKLVKSLHDVFLRAKNYTKWKCYIDILIWCWLMRQLCSMKVADYETLLLEDTNFLTRSREIDGLFKKYGPILSEYSELYQIWQSVSSKSV